MLKKASTFVVIALSALFLLSPSADAVAGNAKIALATYIGNESVQLKPMNLNRDLADVSFGINFNRGYDCGEWYYYRGRYIYLDCDTGRYYYRYRYPYYYHDRGGGFYFRFGDRDRRRWHHRGGGHRGRWHHNRHGRGGRGGEGRRGRGGGGRKGKK